MTVPNRKSKGPACVYARRSKTGGGSEVTFEVQIAPTVAKLEAEGYTVAPEDIFCEKYSGIDTMDERPVLDGIRKRIEAGDWKAIGTWKSDRLGRGYDAVTIVLHAKKHGCLTYFATDPDPNDDEGELLLSIMSWSSKREGLAILARTYGARLAIRSQGDWLGAGPPRDGYIWLKATRERRRDPERAPVIERIFRLAAEGWSAVRIARVLNAEGVPTPRAYRESRKGLRTAYHWSAGNVARTIRERTYLGMQVMDRCVGTGAKKNSRQVRHGVPEGQFTCRPCDRTDRLIDQETWDRANATLRGEGKQWHSMETRNEAKPFLLRGFFRCGICGERMVPQNHVKNPALCSYRCYRYLKGKAIGVTPCRAYAPKRDDVDLQVWALIEARLRGDDVEVAVRRVLADGADALIRADLTSVRAGLQGAKKKFANLIDALADEDSKAVRDAIKLRMKELEGMTEDLAGTERKLLGRLRPYEDREATMARFLTVLNQVRASLSVGSGLTFAEKRDAMALLGVQVFFTQEQRLRLEIDPRNPESRYQNHDPELHEVGLVVALPEDPFIATRATSMRAGNFT